MKTSLYLSFILVFCMAMPAQATHIYSAYISHKSDPQNPRKFDFVLTIFQVAASPADEPFVNINMGDGNMVRVKRSSLEPYSKYFFIGTYTWSYTFPASGTFTATWTAETRNGGIINIAAPSDQYNFQIFSTVRVSPLLQNLYGPKLAGAPLSAAYIGEPWTHNLLAYDADGDQLHYRLVAPLYRTPNGTTAKVPGYQIPQGLTINEFGELHWENPTTKGEYIIAVLITEMRNGQEMSSTLLETSLLVMERIEQPELSLLNKDRLTLDKDGGIKTWPGQPVKLEFFLHKSPNSDQPLHARPFGEIDTLKLVNATLSSRDTLNGIALTYTFTPTPAMERPTPYLIGIRGNPIKIEQDNVDSRHVEHDWAFAYLYVGEQRRPLSSGDDLHSESPKLYPNPARGEFVIEAPNLPGLHLLVRDITGRVVASFAVKPGRNNVIRPVELASGLYTYTLTSGLIPVNSGKLVLQ